MYYLFGLIGFCAGFYAGLLMLKPALKRFSNQELYTDKQLAKKVGWIPWVIALLGMWLSLVCYEYIFMSDFSFFE